MSYTEIRKRHEIVIEFIDEKKGIEYYRNADGKLVSQPMDDTAGYRSSEIAPEVSDALNRARELHRYPSRPMIDNIIYMQEFSIEKAVTYVKYRLLGEATYLDVFGRDAEDRRAAQQHYKKQDEMQKLIFNMATQMNRENKVKYERHAI